MIAFKNVRTAVLVFLSGLRFALSTTPNADIKLGFVKGFVSETPDVADCFGGALDDSHALGTAIENIVQATRKHDLEGFVAGLQKLAAALGALPHISESCKAVEGDVKDIVNAMASIKSLKDLETHIWADIKLQGKNIGLQVLDSVAARQVHDYTEVGRRIGVAVRLLVVGKAAPQPLPPAPKPPYNRNMHTRAPSEMIRAKSGDEIEVYWNLTPLCVEQFQNWLAGIGLFHVSVGFANMRTGMNSTFEFAADKFDLSLIVPQVNDSDDTIFWNNTAQVFAKEGELDVNYWQYRTKLATVNATTYNSMLSWMESAKNKFTRYVLFDLAPVSAKLPQFVGFTCFHFAYAAIQHLAEIAGPCTLDRSVEGLVRNDIALVEHINETAEAASQQDAFSFFKAAGKIQDLWSRNFKETIAELERVSREHRKGRMIYHDKGGQYWAFSPQHPFVTFRKTFAPLPGVCNREVLV